MKSLLLALVTLALFAFAAPAEARILGFGPTTKIKNSFNGNPNGAQFQGRGNRGVRVDRFGNVHVR